MSLERGRRSILAVFGLLLLTASPAPAQWYLSGTFGASADLDATAESPVRSFRLGLSGLADAGRLQATVGIPLQPSDNLLWGFARASTSPFVGLDARRRFGIQPDLSAQGYVYHDPVTDVNGTGGLLSAEPYLAYRTSVVRVRAGGGFRAAGTYAKGGGSPGSVLGQGESVSTSTTAGVAATDLRISLGRRVSVQGRGEALFLDSSTLPHAEFRLVVAHEHGVLWGGVDVWTSDEKRDTGWNIGGSLDLAADLAARASVGRSSGDPLLGAEPRQTWSVGLQYRFADRPGSRSALPDYRAGAVQLRVPADAADGRVYVAGSFNGWTKVPMQRVGDDWTVELPLEPGYYEVAFVDAAGRWFVPEGMTGRRSDGMGGWILALVVK